MLLTNRISLAIRAWRAQSRNYYQKIHDTSSGYQNNNWLVSEIENIMAVNPTSLLEIGCGNGRFLAEAKRRGIPTIIGVDWALSPMLSELGVADLVQTCDVTKDDLPKVDLVCSGDVLEHMAPASLPSTLARLHNAGRFHYHVIACYDDGHSHLAVMPPEEWLALFTKISPDYRLFEVRSRQRKRRLDTACVICNYSPVIRQ